MNWIVRPFKNAIQWSRFTQLYCILFFIFIYSFFVHFNLIYWNAYKWCRWQWNVMFSSELFLKFVVTHQHFIEFVVIPRWIRVQTKACRYSLRLGRRGKLSMLWGGICGGDRQFWAPSGNSHYDVLYQHDKARSRIAQAICTWKNSTMDLNPTEPF